MMKKQCNMNQGNLEFKAALSGNRWQNIFEHQRQLLSDIVNRTVQ